MKLKDVKHEEISFNGEKAIYDFDIYNNRFYLFDKKGRELNIWAIKELPNYLDLKVLEIKRSKYNGYSVGFPTTHIKLDFLDDECLSCTNFKFGDYDTRL